MYCTSDPLNGTDRAPGGALNFHLIPQLKSLDLVNWTYAGDAFVARPGWAGTVGFTRRPVLLVTLDWVDGWPTVRDGRWTSDGPRQAPAA